MIRARRARIVATLGPASRRGDQVIALARAGADVFRVNFSHGGHADHAAAIANVRAAELEVGRPLAVLADLQGPKLRLGEFADGQVRLKAGQDFRLDRSAVPGDASRVCVPHAEIFAVLRPGADILLDDGKVRLTHAGQESRIDKCARPVKVGDQLVFAFAGRLTAITVVALGERRGPPDEARGLYAKLEPDPN